MKPKDQEDLANKLLDTALQHYGTAEPRGGLERRILANLRAESDRLGMGRAWVALTALAFVVIGAATIFLIRKPYVGTRIAATHPVPGFIAKETIATPPAVKRSDVDRPLPLLPRRKRVMAHAALAADDGPKLEQFPSPRPLSEQEEMLARYVRERPEEARLVARAQTELLKQDLLEFTKQNDSAKTPDSMR